MKRTTISLSDDIVSKLEYEARRCQTSVSDVTRKALREHFKLDDLSPREIRFAGIGNSGRDDLSERVDELLAESWAEYIRRDSGLADDR